jgi:hypothetical protein
MENKQPAMSPLADPIVGAIFESVELGNQASFPRDLRYKHNELSSKTRPHRLFTTY